MNTLINGGGVSQFDYTHDNVGNQLSMVSNAGTHNYNYNDIYELSGVTGAQVHSYAYDNVGNRTTSDGISYTDNVFNQYATVNGVTFGYDGNGNLTADGNNTYTYDEENKLLSAQNVLNSAQYGYDAFNRRVSKIVTVLRRVLFMMETREGTDNQQT